LSVSINFDHVVKFCIQYDVDGPSQSFGSGIYPSVSGGADGGVYPFVSGGGGFILIYQVDCLELFPLNLCNPILGLF
jgi:hypothetical protein